jgi:hypothetical protein
MYVGTRGFSLHVLIMDASEWGMAFLYGARAYNSSDLVSLAEYSWREAAAYQVSSADAASGTHPLRSVPFSSTCGGSKRLSTRETNQS